MEGSLVGPLRPLRGHLPLKGEGIAVLTVLPLQGEVPAEQAEGAPEHPTTPRRHRVRPCLRYHRAMRHLPLILLVACSTEPGKSRAPTPVAHPSDTAAPSGEVDFAPGAFARLTSAQYQRALDDLLGDTAPAELQPDTYPYLFATIGAATDALSEQGVQQVEEAATTASHTVFSDTERRVERVGCTPEAPGDACVQAFLTDFGRRAYRRPLESWEHDRWLTVATDLSEGDPWLGLELAVAGMLQSPWVMYRVERGTPHPTRAEMVLLTDYEVATRMALLLWDTIPDDTLLDAAAAGELATTEGRRTHALRMLDDPRADTAILTFFGQYLDLARLDRTSPDPDLFPTFTDTLRDAMKHEVLLLVDDIVNRRDTDARGLFSDRRAYVNAELAAHYGLPTDGMSALAYVPVDLPADSERAGILGLGAFLTMNAHATSTSPTLRGKYLLERVLCIDVPPPPDSVDLDFTDETAEAASLRDQLERHRDDPACNSCHALMDPPGFLFENFGPTGAWRDTDNGVPIDSSGDLSGVPLSGAGALGDHLADHERVGPCMVRQVFRHAHARLDTEADDVTLDQLSESFASSGHRFRSLLVDVIAHESFVVVAASEEDAR